MSSSSSSSVRKYVCLPSVDELDARIAKREQLLADRRAEKEKLDREFELARTRIASCTASHEASCAAFNNASAQRASCESFESATEVIRQRLNAVPDQYRGAVSAAIVALPPSGVVLAAAQRQLTASSTAKRDDEQALAVANNEARDIMKRIAELCLLRIERELATLRKKRESLIHLQGTETFSTPRKITLNRQPGHGPYRSQHYELIVDGTASRPAILEDIAGDCTVDLTELWRLIDDLCNFGIVALAPVRKEARRSRAGVFRALQSEARDPVDAERFQAIAVWLEDDCVPVDQTHPIGGLTLGVTSAKMACRRLALIPVHEIEHPALAAQYWFELVCRIAPTFYVPCQPKKRANSSVKSGKRKMKRESD